MNLYSTVKVKKRVSRLACIMIACGQLSKELGFEYSVEKNDKISYWNALFALHR